MHCFILPKTAEAFEILPVGECQSFQQLTGTSQPARATPWRCFTARDHLCGFSSELEHFVFRPSTEGLWSPSGEAQGMGPVGW